MISYTDICSVITEQKFNIFENLIVESSRDKGTIVEINEEKKTTSILDHYKEIIVWTNKSNNQVNQSIECIAENKYMKNYDYSQAIVYIMMSMFLRENFLKWELKMNKVI